MGITSKPSKYVLEFLSYSQSHQLDPVLSLMCGNADDEMYLAQNGLKVDAVDNDIEKVNSVLLRLQEVKLGRLRIFTADILQPLPFGNHSFNSLYFKFGLHYFSQSQIQQVIIPEIIRVLNPKSLVSIVFRYIDIGFLDRSKNDLIENYNQKVVFFEKSTQKTMLRFIWDESAAKNLFSKGFSVLKTSTQREDIFDRFTNTNQSTIVSLLLTVK
jgi:ubiquinone/menaquinone biosynthesis C-methylase UbiE